MSLILNIHSRCDYDGCLSWDEGLYSVEDRRLWVQSWDLVTILPTDPDQSPYFADRFLRKWFRWGKDCANCQDEIGWTKCHSDPTLTDATSYLKAIEGTIARNWTLCSQSIDSCQRCSGASTCTSCSSKQLVDGKWGTKCADLNCARWNAQSTCCESCKDGYVLESCACVSKSCTVSNCQNCTSPAATTCLSCKAGYFVNGGGGWTKCIDNWIECSSSSSCTKWSDDTFLATYSGGVDKWTKTWGSGQFVRIGISTQNSLLNLLII